MRTDGFSALGAEGRGGRSQHDSPPNREGNRCRRLMIRNSSAQTGQFPDCGH